jgi:hypothetical protein
MADNANGRAFSPAEYNHAQWDSAPERISVSTTTAKTAAVYAAGTYLLTCDVDVFIKSGTQAGVTAATTDNPLWGKTYMLWQVTSADNGGLAGITSSGTGTLYILKPKGVQS